MRLKILPVAIATALFLPAAAAQAATYCVGAVTGCNGPGYASLQLAMDAAKASTDKADIIKLGAGTFTTTDGFVYEQDTPANDLWIDGQGEGTVLKADGSKGSGFKVLKLAGAPGGNLETFISNVKLEGPHYNGGGATAALSLTHASGEYLTITGESGYGAMLGQSGRLRFGSIAMADFRGGVLATGGGTKVEDMKISGEDGITVSGGHLTASRLDISSTGDAIGCNACFGVAIDSSILRIGATGNGLSASAVLGNATINASHLTVFGAVSGNGRTCVAARSVSASSFDAAVNVDNSVFFAIAQAYYRYAGNGGGEADVTAYNNNYTIDQNTSYGPGQLFEAGRTGLATGFVAPLNGDFHLGPKANQIDKGRLAPFVPGAGYDIDQQDRTVNAPDQGADEYQKNAPFAMIAAPSTAVAGEPVAFSGAKSGAGGDPGDAVIEHEWDFKDGTAKVTGAQAEHVFAKAGTYTVLLTVEDLEGQIDSTWHQIVVSEAPTVAPDPEPSVQPTVEPTVDPTVAPTPSATPAAEPTPSATPGQESTTTPTPDTTAPKLSLVRVKRKAFRRKAGTTLSWASDEAGRLSIAVRKGRRVIKRTNRRVVAGTGRAELKAITRRLRPGRHVLVVTATDAAGNRSAPAQIKVTVRR